MRALPSRSSCSGAARRRDRLAAVDVYTAGYLAILLVWPYQDARFWIPVIPILFGYVALGWEHSWAGRPLRWARAAYLGAYGLLGVVALAYSSWISLARDRFPDRFAGESIATPTAPP